MKMFLIKFYILLALLFIMSAIFSQHHVTTFVTLMPEPQHVDKIGCDVGIVHKYVTRKGCVIA